MPIPTHVKNKIQDGQNNIDISNFGLNDKDILELYYLLENNTTVTELNLERNNITSDGAKSISLLKLKKLNLSQNKIDDAGAGFLLKNSCLEEIDLGHNSISDTTANVVLKNLKDEKSKLKYAIVSDNVKIDKKILLEIESLSKGKKDTVDYQLSEPILDLGNSGILGGLLNQSIFTQSLSEKNVSSPVENKGEILAEIILKENKNELANMTPSDKLSLVTKLCSSLGVDVKVETQNRSTYGGAQK